MGYKTKICQHCGKEYLPVSPTQKYCAECAPIVDSIRHAEWYKANIEKVTNRKAKWYKANPEVVKARFAEWKKKNPEKLAGEVRRHHNVRRGLPSDLIFLNLPFDGCEGHHMQDGVHGVYIPDPLHNSVKHNYLTGKGMAEMDALALAYAGLTANVFDDVLPFN